MYVLKNDYAKVNKSQCAAKNKAKKLLLLSARSMANVVFAKQRFILNLKNKKRQHSRWVLPSLILFLSLTIVEHDEGCPIVGFLISHVAQMLLGADKSLTLAHALR